MEATMLPPTLNGTPDEERVYVLYDDRAGAGDTDEANILVVCENEEEAESYKGEYGAMSCFSYIQADGQWRDERHEWNWHP